MLIAVYALSALLLLLLNAFFVFAEFAAVKVRPTRIDELVAAGNPRARTVKHVIDHLDEYLSVCQVGITFCSIALGFVGEPMAHALVQPLLESAGVHSPVLAHAIAVGAGVLLISFVHVLIGEQVPKMIAIGRADQAALLSAGILRAFRWFFFAPLWLLNGSTRLILGAIGLGGIGHGETHSEDELRIILSRSHTGGMMSFRRLLFMENVFDLGELKAKDAMRPRGAVRMLRLGLHWGDQEQFLRAWRFSRYPLLGDDPEKPLGIVHVKDVLLSPRESGAEPDLLKLVRPFLRVQEQQPLEQILGDMQRRRTHVALVHASDGRWTGMLTLEDIIEEIVGTIDDEFESEPPATLADVLTTGRVVLDLDASDLESAIASVLRQVPASDLPASIAAITTAVLERERLVSTYLGRGIAMPHARLPGLDKPALLFARSRAGVPVAGRDERAHLFFILLTPAGAPRIHQRLQARIAGILESDFIDTQLREAESVAAIIEVIRTGEQAALD